MMARILLVMTTALAAASAGCHRPANSASPAIAVAPAPMDYRTLTAAELERLIQAKTGVEVITLVLTGPNRYTGQIMAPGGVPLPLEVTVEAEQIVCDTKTPAGSTRQVITPNGVVTSTLDIR
jgi:hypothetical protein